MAVDKAGNYENISDIYENECFYNITKKQDLTNDSEDIFNDDAKDKDQLLVPEDISNKFENGEKVRIIIKLSDFSDGERFSENTFDLEKTGFVKEAEIF